MAFQIPPVGSGLHLSKLSEFLGPPLAGCLLVGDGLAQEPPSFPIPPSLRGAYFDLWNECAPIDLIVEGLSNTHAADIDLTEERIQTLVESRLRAARLYDAAGRHHLYVRVGVFVSENRRGGAFTTEVSFYKTLRDLASNELGQARTWNTGSYGTHSGDAGYILQSVSEHLDQFMLEYLRVNEAACG